GKSGPVVTLSGNPDCPTPPAEGAKCPDGTDAKDTIDCGTGTCGVCVSETDKPCPPPDPSGCEPGKSTAPGGSATQSPWEFVAGEPSKNLCDGTLGMTMPVWSGC